MLLHYAGIYSQNMSDSTALDSIITLDDLVVSANKVAESRRNVAQCVQSISSSKIAVMQAQSTADVLSSGGVFVQRSQQGGGSPVLRGFEASRVVLMVDGVRMNNIIYRTGHLQNVVTLDNASLERVEILFGPSSTVYGSDALGGVIHCYTKSPILADSGKFAIAGNAFVRYGSVNDEKTGHLDLNLGAKKIASITSFTYSSFGDLHGGKNENPFYGHSYGERPYYVARINGVDSLVQNSDKYLQKQSKYEQYDVMQKLLYRQSAHVSHGLNIQYSNSTDVPRYDRLTDQSATGLAYAEWYYGPQKRLMTAYDISVKKESHFFQDIHAGINFQNIEESRYSRKFGSNNLSGRVENVQVIGANIDALKRLNRHNIRVGIDAQYNMLQSTAERRNIVTNEVSALDTRYPDGDNTMMHAALFASHTWRINPKLILNDGARVGYATLHSTFEDTSLLHLPFTEVNQHHVVYSGSVGLIHTPTKNLKLSLLVSTGFRVPNVDDLSKVFESSGGQLIVPNSDIKPEKTINTELGITKIFGKAVLWESNVYYTHFYDVIVTDRYMFNGQDSVLYDGTMSAVFANQNKNSAYITGFTTKLDIRCCKNFLISGQAAYTYGRIRTDSADAPLDHISPFMARAEVQYTYKKFGADFFVVYNGWKRIADYYLNGEDNEQYATTEGMPAWLTANIRASYKLHKYVTAQVGVDNIFDTQYRVFASGINAPGRNIFVTLRSTF